MTVVFGSTFYCTRCTTIDEEGRAFLNGPTQHFLLGIVIESESKPITDEWYYKAIVETTICSKEVPESLLPIKSMSSMSLRQITTLQMFLHML